MGKGRLVFNLMVVWGATGIWHGANWNFLLWGLYYGVLLVLEKVVWGKSLERLPGWVRHGYTLLLVMVGWALFSLENFAQLGPYLGAMFGLAGAGGADGATLYYLRSYLPMFLIAGVAATPLGKHLWYKFPERAQKIACPLLMLAGLLLSTAYLVDGTYNPFLYFQF